MDLHVTLLGTSASVPTAARGTAATLISRGGERWLVDCGEGTQRQLLRSGLGLVDVDAVLVTHLHADHFLGLPGMLKTYGLRGRTRPLPLVGPRGTAALMQTLAPIVGRLPFALELRELRAGVALAGDGWRIDGFPTRHSVPSLGYALVEDDRLGTFDVAAAERLGVRPGPDYGALQRGRPVVTAAGPLVDPVVRPEDVVGPPRPGRTVVVSGDTEPCDTTWEAARGAAVLVHEATFLERDAERARETLHSTALEAGELAEDAGVGLLVLTHISGRDAPADFLAEAASTFPRVHLGRDFDQIEVPFAERGAPTVGSSRPRRAPAASEAPATVVVPDR
jgi:ribonuclease Z